MFTLGTLSPLCWSVFAKPSLLLKFPYEKFFTVPGKAWLHNNVIMWQIDSSKFPGPALTAPQQATVHIAGGMDAVKPPYLGS